MLFISLTPILLLFLLMLVFRVSGWLSALITLVVTIILAFIASAAGFIPAGILQAYSGASITTITGYSVVEGVLKSVFPILLIILMAIFSYNLLLESGEIEVIKEQFTSVANDKGILVLMMVWGFGGLLEGMAGFGTPVAIPAAILIGLGFRPMFSALVALLGNTVATGFGSVGVPVLTLCNEVSPGGLATPETVREISGFVVVQLTAMFFIIPFIILMLADKGKWLRNIVVALWVGCVSFATQFFCAAELGAETPAVVGSIAAIIALLTANGVIGRVNESGKVNMTDATNGLPKGAGDGKKLKAGEIFRAWSVYIYILLLILFTGPLFPGVEHFLKSHLVSDMHIPVIGSGVRFFWFNNASLWLFLGSVAGGFTQGLSAGRMLKVMARTLYGLRYTFATILSLIAMASVMSHTGMISALADGLLSLTGGLYPLFSPLIGALGTFVTGSDTSSNILFGKLQGSIAAELGMQGKGVAMDLSGSQSNWLIASNTSGATAGKMISPQSIAIATAACDMPGEDDAILRRALPYALLYLAMTGVAVWVGCRV